MSSVLTLSVLCLSVSTAKEAGAGALDEEDFIKAFEDVPSVQVGLVPVTGTLTEGQNLMVPETDCDLLFLCPDLL